MKRHAAHRCMVWLLLWALAVYGYSGAVLQLLGPSHRHDSTGHAGLVGLAALGAQPGAASPSLTQQLHELLRPVRAWRDEMHAKSHAAGLLSHRHSHADNKFERHHHDVGDATVVALDGSGAAAEALADGGATSATGSASLPWGLGFVLTLPTPAVTARTWSRDSAPTWANASVKRLERPPRA